MTIQDILDELVQFPNYARMDKLEYFEADRRKAIAQAKIKIEEMFGEMVGEDINLRYGTDVDIAHMIGYNQRGQEIRNRVEENIRCY
jgi:hypothetical protein